jgi:hypothetical protein
MNKRLTSEKTGPENERTRNAKSAIEVILVVMALTSIVLLMTSCTPKRQDVPVFWGNTPRQAIIAADLHARDVVGKVYQAAPTGSMEPKITGGDYIVVVPIPYKNVAAGMMANYQAAWRPADAPTVTHWVADKQGDKYIMDGQANKHYEGSGQLMGEKEFRGIVVGIYTTRPAP